MNRHRRRIKTARQQSGRALKNAGKPKAMPRLSPLPGTATEGSIGATDSYGNAVNLNYAVVPVVAQTKEGRLRLVGTGFFIGQGLLASAAHVLTDLIESDSRKDEHFYGIVQFVAGDKIYFRPIVTGSIHNVADVGVALLGTLRHNVTNDVLLNPVLTLATNAGLEGERICTYAFPNTRIEGSAFQTVRAEPAFYDGRIVKHYPAGRDRVMLPGACYQTSMVIHGAASGGPVFNSKGHVFALNATGVKGHDVSFVSCIQPLFDLSIVASVNGGDERAYSIRELGAAGIVSTV